MTAKTRVTLFLLLAVLIGSGQAAQAEDAPAPDVTPTAAPAEAETGIPPDFDLKLRLAEEKQVKTARFSILPHKPNYLLPATYTSSPNRDVYSGLSDGSENPDQLEVKFQLSIKTPVWDNIFGEHGTLYAAYSQISFWQAYNTQVSAPFRENNYEPELFLSFETGYRLPGLTSQVVSIGVNHQSNGRSEPLSRSWNRIIANLVFSVGERTYLTLRPWYRIPESNADDDNPHMDRYYGYGELYLLRKLGDHTLNLMVRNNLRSSDNKGAVQIDWSFPLRHKLRGYIQYFNGYGESLVDYNHPSNRIGVGVMLTDWL